MPDYETADYIRDKLLEVGVELRDLADGTTQWRVKGETIWRTPKTT